MAIVTGLWAFKRIYEHVQNKRKKNRIRFKLLEQKARNYHSKK